jgi:beta-lactam-binding protein with PASTA domain
MVARNQPTPVTQASVVGEPNVVALPANMTEVGLPDLRGMSAREALRELARVGLTARMSGTGTVVEQDPPAGSAFEPGATCTLILSRRPATRPPGANGDQR